jgi:YidC/Oxa1 family membrane protein insertase
VDWSNSAVWLPALGLFMIPVISALMSWLSMVISTKTTPQTDETTQRTNKSMMYVMPLISLWICFSMPAALGVYWIFNSVLGIARDYSLTKVYTKQLNLEDAVRAERDREEEIVRQKEETERKKAEGLSEKNPNTSKKKIQANLKQQDDERRAAAERAERAAKRERLGIKENEKPASQVGNRRYARGRAYDPNRFGADRAPKAEASVPAVNETGEN